MSNRIHQITGGSGGVGGNPTLTGTGIDLQNSYASPVALSGSEDLPNGAYILSVIVTDGAGTEIPPSDYSVYRGTAADDASPDNLDTDPQDTSKRFILLAGINDASLSSASVYVEYKQL